MGRKPRGKRGNQKRRDPSKSGRQDAQPPSSADGDVGAGAAVDRIESEPDPLARFRIKTADRGGDLRFTVGDRVECRLGNENDPDIFIWASGTVASLWDYEYEISCESYVAPYQIQLDSGGLIFAPFDSDYCCRPSPTPKLKVTLMRGTRVECRLEKPGGALGSVRRLGTIIQSNEDWIERPCTPYFIRFDDGKCEEFWGPQDCIKESSMPIPPIDVENDDNGLLDPPTPRPDCPICFLPRPIASTAYINQPCCGTTICAGCFHAHNDSAREMGNTPSCPFCRMPDSEDAEEILALMRKRMELDDAENIYCMGVFYCMGDYGLPKNRQKAFDLFLRAAELGSPRACVSLAMSYAQGVPVPKDETKLRHYLEMAAKLGDVEARHELGVLEVTNGYHDVAIKHWRMSAAGGYQESVDRIRSCYQKGMLSKEEYADALRDCHRSRAEEWSKEREGAKSQYVHEG